MTDLLILGGKMKKQARCYNQIGWWKFYKTEDGHCFTVRDNTSYWYDGNFITGDKTGKCFIEMKYHEELFNKIEFVD